LTLTHLRDGSPPPAAVPLGKVDRKQQPRARGYAWARRATLLRLNVSHHRFEDD